MMDGMMNDSSMMWLMCIMMTVGVLLLVVIIGMTVYVVANLLIKKSKLEYHPVMLLQERYIKDEINEEEFKRKRKMLSNL
jgi:putative membrane protein